jgi:ATP-dependent Clp protease protease subunit
MNDTIQTQPIAKPTAAADDVAGQDITHKIESHDYAGALSRLHIAAHAMNETQFHDLLTHLASQNQTDLKINKDLPVVHLTNINGVAGLEIDDGKKSITFCEGNRNQMPPAAVRGAIGGAVGAPSGKEGVFYFYGEVNQQSALSLTQQMEMWADDPKNKDQPIRIVMNSPGGSVFDGFSMMDEIARMRRAGHHVKIEDYGMAASAAGWIMQAADTRAIGANSWMLIHEPSGQATGKLSTMGAEVHLSKDLEDQFLGVFAARSHLSADDIRKHIDDGRDWWIPAGTAKELGLVDQVEEVPPFHPEEPAQKPTPTHR